MRAETPRKAAASRNGPVRRGLVKKTLRFVGEHPKATATALAAGVGAYALAYRAKKAVTKAARKVGNAVEKTSARIAAPREKRVARASTKRTAAR
jgi:hypothetical protein